MEETKDNLETTEAAGTPETPETPVTEVIEAAAESTDTVEAPTAAASASASEKDRGKRAEKVGLVTSDKMTRTVVVRVDRLVKHPVYKRYVRRRTKFMAHNEIEGVSLGDVVRIVETRPLSARKRWRVVEVLRKASK